MTYAHIIVADGVVRNKDAERLGTIGWEPRWRCHVFSPLQFNVFGTTLIFSADCLRDIATELETQDRERAKANKRKAGR